MRDLDEAQKETRVAKLFGRDPADWATELLEEMQREDETAGTMSLDEAMDVLSMAAFDDGSAPRVTHEQLAEAHRALAHTTATASTETLAAPAALFESVAQEVRSLAQSRFGYSEERAVLYAKGEALRCREFSANLDEAISSLKRHRDAMEQQPRKTTATSLTETLR